ncbi:hypothetical protein FHS43_005802 [Streptosporangium becharense]|uniref:Uncharacterized protein n=1 Tax=Streptosporangium becharense TaxID=1816182 RepID=A0A7W9IM94_9ACTN|nr:hypothetical protein [Streptosporangium becharense]MBB5823335.1 hypothetical protein [Streptosporangium becharense]
MNDRYLPDGGLSSINGMPPPSRNHRDPTGPDTPQARAASSLVSPSAIFLQNARSTSRRIGGRPGDRIADRPVRVVIHPAGLPMQHLRIKVLRRPVESALNSSIRVVDEAADVTSARPDRHFQGVECQVSAQVVGDLPTNDPPRVQILHERGVDPADRGRHIGDVRDPSQIRPVSGEVAFQQVTRPVLAGGSGAGPLTACGHPSKPELAHQPLDRAPGHRDFLPIELSPHLPRPMKTASRAVPHPQNLSFQVFVSDRTSRRTRLPLLGRPIRGRRNFQHSTDRLHTELFTMGIDELD